MGQTVGQTGNSKAALGESGAGASPAHTNSHSATAQPHGVAAPLASPEKPQPPRLADYTDFRQYLKDVYEFRRETESTGLRAYSYSAFSAAADIRSPNYLKLIIEGRRNLSDDMISRFARALRLNKLETEEFRVLVHYGQATEPIQRNQFLKELADLRAERAFASGAISEQAWEKIPGWMGWVIFAMTDQAGVQFDPEELYKLIRAKTSPDDVKGALRKLMQEGHLVGESASQMAKGRDLIESPQDLPVAMIRKLQAELIYLGIESLFRDSPKEREFGAMTMAMTQEEFDHVRFELRQLRKRLQKDLMVRRQSSKGDRVYQLNIQLFPVTDPAGH
ncbi:MAG TPA: TIGR02147 family protein [Pseudobdellovibrionaceae bacterium]|nr:TIGR02147 family protein [Pseudobdellovibrionaceae bacterium]